MNTDSKPAIIGPFASEESVELDKIQENYRLLDSYLEEISSTGKISREQARVMVSQCSIELDSSLPLEGFTEHASTQGASVAVESIGQAAVQMLTTLVKKAAELMTRLVKWLMDLVRKRRRSNEDIRNRAKSLSTIKSVQRMAASLGISPSAIAEVSGNEEVDATRNYIDTAIQQYDAAFTELSYDFLTTGPITQTTRKFMVLSQALAMSIESKLVLMDEIIKQLSSARNDEAQAIVINSKLNTVIEPMRVDSWVQAMQSSGMTPPLQRKTVWDLTTALISQIQLAMKNTDVDVIDYMSVADLFSDPNGQLIMSINIMPDQQERSLKEMERRLTQLRSTSTLHISDDGLRQKLTQALNQITENVRAYEQLVLAGEAVSKIAVTLLDNTLRIRLHESRLIELSAVQSGRPQAIQKIQEINKKVKREMGQFSFS